MRCIGVYGSSGFGREVLPLVRQQHETAETEIVLIDDNAEPSETTMTFEAFARLPHPEKRVTIAIANSAIREKLAANCRAADIDFVQVRAPNSLVLDNVEIGEGAILCGFTHLTSDIRIGRHFHANIYSYVAHDCVIGDFVTFGPGVMCNGNIHVEDHVYVGTGAIIKQGTPDKPRVIGKGAVIGMGAVVTKDVAPGETVIGNPARPMQG